MNTKLVTMSQIIGENGVFLDGDWVESKDQDPSGSIRLIQLADIGDGYFIDKSKRYLTKESALNLKCTFLKQNDILIARMPDPIGRACIFPHLDTECVTVVDVCIVRPDKSIVLPEYLKYLINNQVFRRKIQMYVTGTTRQRISRGNLAKIEFKLPPLEDQKRIIKLLDQADELRQKRKESIGLLDDYLKAVFFDMFGDIESNTSGWELTNLSKITNKITDGTHQSPKFTQEGIPFIFISNIISNEISLDTKRYISENEYNALTKNTPIEKYDVLYTTVGSYGNPAIVKTDEKFCFQRHIAHIKPDHGKTNVYFLYAMLKSPSVKKQVDNKAKGIAQKTLNLTDLKNLNVILPPIDLQNQFGEIVKETEQTKQKMLKQLEEMDNQFKALMQKTFST